jgi:FkbM family methyltransferase
MGRLIRLVRAAVRRSPLAPYRRFRRAVKPVEREGMVRIGTDYGGWTIPDDLVDPSWVCYSGGVGYDISFDRGFIERYGCTVHAFDPTPSAIRFVEEEAADLDRFRFHPWGLWSEDGKLRFYAPDYSDTNFSAVNLHDTDDYFEAPSRSLPSIMRELGHERIDLLKLDIEGAEFEVLRAVVDGDVHPAVICVEYHKERGPRIGPMVESVRALKARGYEVVAVNGYDVTLVARDYARTGAPAAA